MHDSARRSNFALGALALALCACAPYSALPERQFDAPECGYVEAREARQQAQQSYDDHERTGARAVRLREARRTLEAAQRREQDAQNCEQRARDWSDLSAQWQSARAAVAVREIAFAQALLTLGEIVALIATIWVGIWAVRVTREISETEILEMKTEAADAATRAALELTEAKAANDAATETGHAQVRCYLDISSVETWFGGDAETEMAFPEVSGDPRVALLVTDDTPRVAFKLRNAGQSPARLVNWAPSIKFTVVDNNGSHVAERQGQRRFPTPESKSRPEWGETIAAGDDRAMSGDICITLNSQERDALWGKNPDFQMGLQIVVVITLIYADVFGEFFEESHAFMGGGRNYKLGARIKMEPFPIHVFELTRDMAGRPLPNTVRTMMVKRDRPAEDGGK